MVNPFEELAKEQYKENPQGKKNPYSSPFEQMSHNEKFQEDLLNTSLRYASQIPQGLAATTTPGLVAGLWEMLASGEIHDPEEIEHIKKISEREGIPFDEAAYLEAGKKALGGIPTVSNIASKIEEKTGIPLEPKTRGQKGLRFATEATRLAPENSTLRPLNTALPKPVVGAGVEATKELLTEAGLPEPISELASFGIIKQLPEGVAKINLGTEKKPSGLTERQFEKLTEPREVSAKKLNKINEKLKTDFKDISDKIIQESPIGETANNLRNDPKFKQESRELLNQAQEIANLSPGSLDSKFLKNEISNTAAKKIKGVSLGEYDKNYIKFMNESMRDIVPKRVTMGELVEQYRKNNESLGEYFEPGSSKALNRAKRDALLDYNRSIANVLEYQEPELSKVFTEGNQRWTKIMDAEVIDEFIDGVFKDGLNHKKLHDFFDKSGYDRIFKRSLGEKGFKEFEQLVSDMITTEVPYKMLKVAKEKGYDNLFNTMFGYMIHPKIGIAKAGFDSLKYTYKGLLNSILDKPQVGLKFNKAVKELKAGNFAAAEKDFKVVESEILLSEKEGAKDKN
jgi:hypothetical protein